MGGQKLVFGLVGIVVVGILGFAFFKTDTSQNQVQESTTTAQQTSEVKGAQKDQEISSSTLEQRYLSYSEENLSHVAANNGKAVIFFAASWCPMCQEAEKDFKANFDKVPADVTILKTDYDTSSDLKEKYKIVMQDTFVQVDKDGNEITKWNSGGKGIETLLANVK